MSRDRNPWRQVVAMWPQNPCPDDNQSPKSLTGLTVFHDGKASSLEVKNVFAENFNNPAAAEGSTRGGTATISNSLHYNSFQEGRSVFSF